MRSGSHGATLIRPGIFVADSVTSLGREVGGSVVIAGSHCGVYAAYLAARAKVRAVILNDAGIGLDQAGIAGLAYLERIGIPAAAISHDSARIGDGADTAARGVLTHVNPTAQTLGCAADQTALDAALRLQVEARAMAVDVPEVIEGRHPIDVAGRIEAVGLDSASLIEDCDEGRVVITASHGALLGGDPDSALRVGARAAFFNDAGVGRDHAGISRLPELDRRGVIAATVSHWTARIGDSRSSWQTGVLSHLNQAAQRAGAKPGMRLSDFIRSIAGG
jgi:hypothetical protein